MAAPHVTGAVALLLAVGELDPVARLKATAVDLGAPGFDIQYGYGLIDLEAALPGYGSPDAPSVPTGLSASGDHKSVTLRWSASSDDTGVTLYRIYRDGALAGTASGTSFIDGGIKPNNTFRFEVQAVDAAENASAKSTPLDFSAVPNGKK